MSRVLAATSSQYLKAPFVPAFPFTVSLWFQPTGVLENTIWSLSDALTTVNYFRCRASGVQDFRLSAAAGGASNQITTGAWVDGQWSHVACVVTSATDRALFADGGSKVTDTVSRAPAGIDDFYLGVLGQPTPSGYTTGKLAHACIWNVALSDGEVASLAAGTHPFDIQPNNLVMYLPMTGSSLVDEVGGLTFTNFNGSTVDGMDNPVVASPSGGGSRVFDDAATQFLRLATTPLTTPPMTFACWFKSDDLAVAQSLVGIYSSQNSHLFRLSANGNLAGQPVVAQTSQAAPAEFVETSTGYSTGTWRHGAAVFASPTSRISFIDGGSKSPEGTLNVVPALLDRLTIGARDPNTGPLQLMSGKLAYAVVWRVALSDAEILDLANGKHPGDVQPENIVLGLAMTTPSLHDPPTDGTFQNVNGVTFDPADTPPVDPAGGIAPSPGDDPVYAMSVMQTDLFDLKRI